MSLTGNQAKFASVFARDTGLDPKVVGAWLLAEQSGSAAKYYEGKGYNNWLNIANTDSGQKGGSHSNVWKNPESAAKASAEWMRGQGQIAREYGKPASSITAILGSHGQVPHRQIQAIANSGWASSGYEHGNTLSQLLGQVGNIPTTGPGPLPGLTRQAAVTSFNNQGYQQATQHAAGLRAAASLFSGGGAGDAALRGALEKAGEPPEASKYQVVKTPSGPMAVKQGSPEPSVSNNLHGILPEGAKVIEMNRKDQGRDVQLNPGQALLAPGKFIFLGTKSDPSGFGPDYPIIKVLTGQFAGHDLYYGHTDVAHGLTPGKVYAAGTHVATTSRTGHNAKPGWLELGYAPGGSPGSFGQPSPF